MSPGREVHKYILLHEESLVMWAMAGKDRNPRAKHKNATKLTRPLHVFPTVSTSNTIIHVPIDARPNPLKNLKAEYIQMLVENVVEKAARDMCWRLRCMQCYCWYNAMLGKHQWEHWYRLVVNQTCKLMRRGLFEKIGHTQINSPMLFSIMSSTLRSELWLLVSCWGGAESGFGVESAMLYVVLIWGCELRAWRDSVIALHLIWYSDNFLDRFRNIKFTIFRWKMLFNF